MANEEQLSILKQGVVVWNEWRTQNPDLRIDLSEADLHKTKLIGAYLSGVNLFDANLGEANLSRANLKRADLKEANLISAHLWQANLSETDFRQASLCFANLNESNLNRANLEGADLLRTKLGEANLRRANLKEANLKFAYVGNTTFGGNDLSETFGLEGVIHGLPSTIGTDTIRLSKGKIPEVFLRGCGLSDLDIEYAKLTNPGLDPEQVTEITYKIHRLYVKGGIQYYSCFISYSSRDQEFAQRLHDDLQDNGVRCWFAPEDMKIGDPIRPTIDRQIRLRDKLLVILSKNSVKSEWVGDEVEGAIEEESKSNRLVLFPIRLDETVLNTRDDWAAKIKRRRHIGDFSNWKDKVSYQKAFERLLRDLKATGIENALK